MVDDATRFMFVALLATKDEAAQAVKKIKAQTEKETGRELKVLRTDNGGEFTCSELAEYFAMEGVKRHTRHSRIALWNGGTKLWWPRRGLCSSSAACRLGFWGRRW